MYRLCCPVDIALHGRLPSGCMTRLFWYYAVIRLAAGFHDKYNPHLVFMKYEIIALSDRIFAVSITYPVLVCPEYHIAPLHASLLPGHWRIQLHYARSGLRPCSRLSIRQSSFYPHIQFFILLCLV